MRQFEGSYLIGRV